MAWEISLDRKGYRGSKAAIGRLAESGDMRRGGKGERRNKMWNRMPCERYQRGSTNMTVNKHRPERRTRLYPRTLSIQCTLHLRLKKCSGTTRSRTWQRWRRQKRQPTKTKNKWKKSNFWM